MPVRVPGATAGADLREHPVNGAWLDRVARALVRDPHSTVDPGHSGAPRLARRTLLRHGIVGALAVAGLTSVRLPAASSAPLACTGGTLAGCLKRAEKLAQSAISSCSDYDNPGEPIGSIADRIRCQRLSTAYGQSLRTGCRKQCPQKRKKKGGGSGGGGGASGGGSGGSGGGGSAPGTCGGVSCATGNTCCPDEGGPICCAVGCNKSGKGCCSSESDCKP